MTSAWHGRHDSKSPITTFISRCIVYQTKRFFLLQSTYFTLVLVSILPQTFSKQNISKMVCSHIFCRLHNHHKCKTWKSKKQIYLQFEVTMLVPLFETIKTTFFSCAVCKVVLLFSFRYYFFFCLYNKLLKMPSNSLTCYYPVIKFKFYYTKNEQPPRKKSK